MKRALILTLLPMLIASCFEKEEPVIPFPRGDVAENQFAMGSDYDHQIFFDIGTNTIVSSNLKTAWDIGLGCNDENRVVLNTGRNMFAAETKFTEFDDVSDTIGLDFRWDFSNGRTDSTAMFNCFESDKIWVINLGYDLEFNQLGFVKVRIGLEGNKWIIEYADLDSADTKVISITKDPNYNHLCFSFLNNEVVEIEPNRKDFDLVFRQYIYYFPEENIPYLVMGALSNTYNTQLTRVYDKEWTEVSVEDTLNYPLSSVSDVIGYDWKIYDLNEGSYVVFADQIYILKDSEGFLYKLHFIDFYSTDGEKGYPKIEFERL